MDDDAMHLEDEIATLKQQIESLERQRQHDYYEGGRSYFEMVRHFHEKFELVIRDEPIDFSFENNDDADNKLFTLRRRLHDEEWGELNTAWYDEDLVKFVDACADFIYVILGTMVSFGIPFDECFAEVQRSNMSKLGEDGEPIKREDGKILKGPNFSPPDLHSIIYGQKG